jgi:hypothetical protein
MSKQLMFFATKEDIKPVLLQFEDFLQVKYFKAGLFDTSEMNEIKSLSSIPNLGIASTGDWNTDQRYVIVLASNSLTMRSIQQKDGTVKYAVDLLANPNGCVIQLGGIYNEKILLAGKIGIVSKSVSSDDIFRKIRKIIIAAFTKVDEFYVGNDALMKLKAGWRLVADSDRSKEYDLAIPIK